MIFVALSTLSLTASNILADVKTFTPIECHDGRSACISGINNAGQIIGYYLYKETCYFVRDRSGEFTRIEDLSARKIYDVTGINDAGRVVGYYVDYSDIRRGFFHDRSGDSTPIDYPDAGTQTIVLGLNPHLRKPKATVPGPFVVDDFKEGSP